MPALDRRSIDLYQHVRGIGDATIVDAMLDGLVQNNHRFTLTGESMRKKTATKVKTNAAAVNPGGA